MRGGMWKRPLDHGLVESWLARALELADAGGAAQAKALVTKSMWEDDAEPAEQAVALAERLDDPVLLSYAYWARSGAAFVDLDFHEADRWAQRRFELLDRLTDPDKIAHIHYYGATAALAAGRPDEAEMLVRKHDIVASRLSTHHEVHALARPPLRRGGARTLGRGATASASRRAGRRRQRRARRACSIRGRSSRVPSRAASSVSTPRRGDSRRSQSSRAFEGGGLGFWLDPPPAHLALLRGDLERVDGLLESSGETWQWSLDGSLYALATKLDALIALGRTSEAEETATSLLQPGTYLEPFALRTLGRVRSDPALTEQAVERFEAMGLGWHAAKTRALAPA